MKSIVGTSGHPLRQSSDLSTLFPTSLLGTKNFWLDWRHESDPAIQNLEMYQWKTHCHDFYIDVQNLRDTSGRYKAAWKLQELKASKYGEMFEASSIFYNPLRSRMNLEQLKNLSMWRRCSVPFLSPNARWSAPFCSEMQSQKAIAGQKFTDFITDDNKLETHLLALPSLPEDTYFQEILLF